MISDTIAAIATGMSDAGIGIIRISGAQSLEIIDKIFFSIKEGKKISEAQSHTIHYGHIKDGNEILDEVLVSLMRGPNSFTKEDIVEINCHGGTYVLKRVLELVISEGARPSEPGEFTKRAFLNGRLDLSQAEAVIDIINSKNEYALNSSVHQLKGAVLEKISTLREEIIHEIAYIESALDDPEHIDLEGYENIIQPILTNSISEHKKLLDSYQNGRIMKEGIQTVIVGKPNAGKSSLLNYIIGEERAIVTDIAGTTRDVLQEHINFYGLSLNLIDTAGIRETEDIVEKIGVDRAKENLLKADLIIFVIDSSIPLDQNDFEIIEMIKGKKGIVLLNKSDLESKVIEAEIKCYLEFPVFPISAKEMFGIENFANAIKEMFYSGDINFNDQIYLTNVRHRNYLEQSLRDLENVLESVELGMPEDFYSIDLRNSYSNLGFIIGESMDDDLVNEIFSKFCTGK